MKLVHAFQGWDHEDYVHDETWSFSAAIHPREYHFFANRSRCLAYAPYAAAENLYRSLGHLPTNGQGCKRVPANEKTEAAPTLSEGPQSMTWWWSAPSGPCGLPRPVVGFALRGRGCATACSPRFSTPPSHTLRRKGLEVRGRFGGNIGRVRSGAGNCRHRQWCRLARRP